MTRASAVVSTSAPTMIRSPAPRTISIRPTGSDVTAATLDTGSVVIVTGTSCGLSRLSAILAAPCCRRQVNRRLALTPWCRATSATEAPGSKLSAIIRRLRSIDQACRRRRPCNPSASSPSDICDSVHYHLSGHDHRATPTHYRPSSASARRPSPKGNGAPKMRTAVVAIVPPAIDTDRIVHARTDLAARPDWASCDAPVSGRAAIRLGLCRTAAWRSAEFFEPLP
jgi:hypothetical protein